MNESKEELTKKILDEGEDVDFSQKEFKLSEEEEEKIDNIGKENFDYCVTALLHKRNSDHEFELNEGENKIAIDDFIELEFNPEVWLNQNDSRKEAIANAVGYISTVFVSNIENFQEKE